MPGGQASWPLRGRRVCVPPGAGRPRLQELRHQFRPGPGLRPGRAAPDDGAVPVHFHLRPPDRGNPDPVLLAVTGIARLGRWPATPATWTAPRPRPCCGPGARPGGRAGLMSPGWHAPSDELLAFAAELIDRSGTAPVIEAALAPHRPAPPAAGARGAHRAFCLALDDRPLFLTDATRLLFCQLPAPPGSCSASLAPPPPSGRSWPLTAGSATASASCSGDGSLGAAEKPPADRRGPQSPHQANDPRSGRRGPGGWRRGPMP